MFIYVRFTDNFMLLDRFSGGGLYCRKVFPFICMSLLSFNEVFFE